MPEDQDGLPEGWTDVPLREVLSSLESGSRPKGGVRGIPEGLPSIGGEHLSASGGFDFTSIKYVPLSFYQSMKRGHIRPGDVLVVKDGATTGKTSLVRDDFPFDTAVVNEHVFVCRPSAVIDPAFLFWFLWSQSGQRRILENFQGSAQGGINQAFAQATVVPVAPRAEQRRIVGAVEALLDRVNAARGRLAKVPAIMKRFRQAVLAAACSGRLTEQWRFQRNREASPDDSLAAEGARLHLDNLPELPEIPATWGLTTIGDVAAELRYGANSKAGSNASGGVPILRMGNIQDGHLDLGDLKYVPRRGLAAFGLRYGDILFNRTNSPELVGKAAVFDRAEEMVYASYLIRVRTDPDRLVPRYLCWWINSGWGRAWARAVRTDGVSQSNINATKLASMPLPLPSPSEQQEIVRRVEALFGLAQVIERRVAAATFRAERLTQAILTRAFRGELVPTEAELARREEREYEQAEVLLERIRRERAVQQAKSDQLHARTGRSRARRTS